MTINKRHFKFYFIKTFSVAFLLHFSVIQYSILTYWVTMLFNKPGHQSWYPIFVRCLCAKELSKINKKKPEFIPSVKTKKPRKAHTHYL